MDPLQIVFHYHDRTKHHPQRYARSLGYLDWATQPDPFRRFAGAELIPLPHLAEDDTPPYEVLYAPGRVPPAPLTAHALSRFFECSLAISAWKEYRGTRWALRVNPSSGNLHPTEGYMIVGPVEGIGSRPGVYHYAPKEHALERRAEFGAETWQALITRFPAGSFLVGLSSVLWRETWKYGERAFRYCQHDVGHALAAVRLAASMLGWGMVMIDGMGDDDISRLLGLNRGEDFAAAEPEHPDLVAVVFPEGAETDSPAILDRDAMTRIASGEWIGKANTLSRDHVEWDIIDLVANTTHRGGPSAEGGWGTRRLAPGRLDSLAERNRHSAHRIIRTRRSAVAFDGQTRISADTFYHILSRVTPSTLAVVNEASRFEASIPFDTLSWSPRIHLGMFVHRVTGLTPGLYALVRDAERLDALKAATKPDFAWSKPNGCPESLPLYFLLEADCRRPAAQLSLMQDIAGDGVFSLGMIADFERSLRQFGPWFYRRLYWEAGVIGQVLYLEAEAAGIRSTGIGAYFDDWVHEVFGLTGHAFQSLYHFSMGGPVEDARLTTLPAYPWSRD